MRRLEPRLGLEEGGNDLAAMQARFWRLLVAPEGVGAELEVWRREDPRGAQDAEPERWIVAHGDDEAGRRELAARRLGVYADMYFYRLHDLLAEDYPALQGLLGAERFHNLVTDYLVAHPPATVTVRDVGEALPAFVAEGHAMSEPWPFAAALARLEWARRGAVDGTDAELLRGESLAALAPEAWAELPLSLVPTAELLTVDYAVLPLWRAVADGEALETLVAAGIAQEPTEVLVWRQGFAVCHRGLDVFEARALRLVARGTTFAGVCEVAADHETNSDPSVAAQRAITWLQRWLGDELLQNPS